MESDKDMNLIDQAICETPDDWNVEIRFSRVNPFTFEVVEVDYNKIYPFKSHPWQGLFRSTGAQEINH